MVQKMRVVRLILTIQLVVIGFSPAFAQTEISTQPELEELNSEAPPESQLDTSGIEEIRVTSQARQTHDESSISETSFGASDLKEMRIQDISDMARFTPGLEINTAFAASNPTLFIRGIGLKDYNANASGAVSIFFDGLTINSPVGQLFQLFDIKNVTVLKGPQSGRFGRNATAGAIIVDSNLPDGTWSSDGSITYGSYNTFEATGAIGFPIIEDTLSGRIAFTYNRRDGYTRNGCANWDPEAHGMQIQSRAETQKLYAELDPLPMKQTVWQSQAQVGNPSSAREEYIYGNTTLAAQLLAGNEDKSIKRRFDASGNPTYAVKGPGFSLGSGRDTACVINPAGRIINYQGQEQGLGLEGTFEPYTGIPTFEDFQGLNDWTNNADNWATRAMFLWTPAEDVEVLFSLHGGQNLGDSAHLQMIPAVPGTVPTNAECTESNPCRSPEGIPIPFRNPNIGGDLRGWNEGAGGEPLIPIEGILEANRGDAPGLRGADPYLGFYDRDGKELLDVWGIGIIGQWDLENFSLHSLSGYEANQRTVEDEGDATPLRFLWTDWNDQTWQVSQEFRIEGASEDYTWSAGVYGLYEELRAVNTYPATLGRMWTQSFKQDLNAFAVFATGFYDIINGRNALPWIEMLRLSASLRWSREHKDFNVSSSVTNIENGIQANVIQAPEIGRTWKGLTGDVMLSWTPFIRDAFEFELHTKFSHGMKNGHFNAGLSEDPNPLDPTKTLSLLQPVPPEYVNALEIGFDSSFLENRLVVSGAFYRYWYQDLQVFDLVNEAGSLPTQQLLSADANVKGFEADIEILPIEDLTIGLGFNWLDSKFAEFIVSKRQTVGGGAGGGTRELKYFSYTGNPTIAAPEFQLNGMVQYELFVSDWGSFSPRFDYSYQTKVYLDPQGLELISMPAYWYLDLGISYRTPDQDIEITIWGSNLTNQEYLVDVFDVSREYEDVLQVWGEPRMFGITVSFAY